MNPFSQKIPPLYSLPLLKGGWGRDFVVGISVLVFFLLPFIGFAQGYVPLAPLPGQPAAYEANQGALPAYLATIYKLGIGAAGVLAVLMLVWGGFQYTTSEAIQGKSDAKGIIQNVLWGGAIVLGSYLLLFTINPRLVDIGLALTNLRSVTKTRIPSPEETYGKFLDDALRRAQNISTKAKELKITGDAVEGRIQEIDRKFREGDFTPEEIADNMQALNDERETLTTRLQELRTKETLVRSYEGAVDYLSTDMRTQINRCLAGEGTCSVQTGLLDRLNPTNWTWIGGLPRVDYTIASKDKVANNAVIDQMLAAARAKVNSDKQKLVAAGLTEQATELERRMQNIEGETAFQRRCPNSKTHYISGRGLESGPCPQ